MNKKIVLLILILSFLLLLGVAYFLYDRLGQDYSPAPLPTQLPPPTQSPSPSPSSSPSQTPKPSESTAPAKSLAPDFTVYDAQGNEVRLSDFVGKPTVVNFWASWCGPCKSEMPAFQEKYLALGDQVNFLMINVTDGSRETVEKAADFIAQQGYTFPVFYDTKSIAAATYGVYALPTTFFIDAEGYGTVYVPGAITAATLQQGIDIILPKN